MIPQWVQDKLPNINIESCSVNGDEAIVVVRMNYGMGDGGSQTKVIILNKKTGIVGHQG